MGILDLFKPNVEKLKKTDVEGLIKGLLKEKHPNVH